MVADLLSSSRWIISKSCGTPDEGVGAINTGCRGEVLVHGIVAGAVVLTEGSFLGHNPPCGSLSPLPILTVPSRGCYIRPFVLVSGGTTAWARS